MPKKSVSNSENTVFEDSDGNSYSMRVCVRIRPIPVLSSSEEPKDGLKATVKRKSKVRKSEILSVTRKCVEKVDSRMLLFDPSSSNAMGRPSLGTGDSKRTKNQSYAFDYVFGEKSTQKEVFESSMEGLVEGILKGYNATVFAYGATGAGKTHTISGKSDDPGIMPLTMQDLFERIEKSIDKVIDISVSYLEVYNETVRDLLVSSNKVLDVREDSDGRVFVANLSEHHPKTGAEVMELLEKGSTNRTKSPTKANEDSSRSHAVFQINIKQRDRACGLSASVTSATLTLCDLAGSERASVTENRGKQMREGANINRSLLALGNCINALSDKSKRGKHIPYRDSKLTRLLKYSLGGNCRTVMVAHVSPAWKSYEETLNTLKYASRAKLIQLDVERNSVNVSFHVGQYLQIIEDLKAEVSALRSKLAEDQSDIKQPHEFQVSLPKSYNRGETCDKLSELKSKIDCYKNQAEQLQNMLTQVVGEKELDKNLNNDWLYLMKETQNQLETRYLRLVNLRADLGSSLDKPIELPSSESEHEGDLSTVPGIYEHENNTLLKHIINVSNCLVKAELSQTNPISEAMGLNMELIIEFCSRIDKFVERFPEMQKTTQQSPKNEKMGGKSKPLKSRRKSNLPVPINLGTFDSKRRQTEAVNPVAPKNSIQKSRKRRSMLPVPTNTLQTSPNLRRSTRHKLKLESENHTKNEVKKRRVLSQFTNKLNETDENSTPQKHNKPVNLDDYDKTPTLKNMKNFARPSKNALKGKKASGPIIHNSDELNDFVDSQISGSPRVTPSRKSKV